MRFLGSLEKMGTLRLSRDGIPVDFLLKHLCVEEEDMDTTVIETSTWTVLAAPIPIRR